MADSVEHHFAGEHQPYRPACLSRSGRRKRTERPRPELASKARTHKLRDNPNTLDRQAEHLREHTPQVDYSLRGLVQRQPVTFPYRSGRMWLEWIMRFKWRDVGLIELDGRAGERSVR